MNKDILLNFNSNLSILKDIYEVKKDYKNRTHHEVDNKISEISQKLINSEEELFNKVARLNKHELNAILEKEESLLELLNELNLFTMYKESHASINECITMTKKLEKKTQLALKIENLITQHKKGSITENQLLVRTAVLTGDTTNLKENLKGYQLETEDFILACHTQKNQLAILKLLWNQHKKSQDAASIDYRYIEREAISHRSSTALQLLYFQGLYPNPDNAEMVFKTENRKIINIYFNYLDSEKSDSLLRSLVGSKKMYLRQIVNQLIENHLTCNKTTIMILSRAFNLPGLLKKALTKGFKEGTLTYSDLEAIYLFSKELQDLNAVSNLNEATKNKFEDILNYKFLALRFSLQGEINLGLNEILKIESPKILVDLEGFNSHLTLHDLVVSLKSYNLRFREQPFSSSVIEALNFAVQGHSPEEHFKRYQSGKPCVLFSNWPGHTTGLILQKIDDENSLLLKLNKGEGGSSNPGFTVYEFQGKGKIDIDFFSRFLEKRNISKTKTIHISKTIEPEYFQKDIDKDLGLTPISHFLTKPQKSGNCPFATSKLMLRALLYLEKWQEKGFEKPEKTRWERMFSKFHTIKKDDSIRQEMDPVYHKWRDSDITREFNKMIIFLKSKSEKDLNHEALYVFIEKLKTYEKKNPELYKKFMSILDRLKK